LIENVLNKFDKDAALFINTKVYKQKREFLKENILFDLQTVFEKQVQKIKDISLYNFRESLAPIQITNRVENDIQVVFQTVDIYFKEVVKSLTSKYSSGIWYYEREHRQLKQEMRDISIERLQMAKLQGMHFHKNKNPVNLSFHFLHPHPFGKDLRYDYMNSNDSFSFNPNYTQKAGNMRYLLSNKGNNVKIISPEESNSFSDSTLIYKDNPMNAFQNNNH